MKKILLFLIAIPLLLNGCSNTPTSDDKLQVVTSFYPLYDFATKIGGDKANVTNIIPAGVEAHGFEPTPNDITNLENADIFIYHGAGFESWTDQVISSLKNDIVLVEVSKNVTLIVKEDDHDHNEHEGHDHGIYDPHTWLDPHNALLEATTIYEAFVLADPDNKDYYTKNYEAYAEELETLINEYDSTLVNTQGGTIIVDHLAYSYLANRYNLKQLSITGGIVNEEPTAKEIEATIDFINEHKVKAIYMETFSNQDVMNTVSQQTGAQILTLNTVETLSATDLENGRDYISIMKDNLENLKEGFN